MPKSIQPVAFDVSWLACIQCGACVAVCPQREPFISPFDTIAIDIPCHIACMHCVAVCPTSAISHRPAGGAAGNPAPAIGRAGLLPGSRAEAAS